MFKIKLLSHQFLFKCNSKCFKKHKKTIKKIPAIQSNLCIINFFGWVRERPYYDEWGEEEEGEDPCRHDHDLSPGSRSSWTIRERFRH